MVNGVGCVLCVKRNGKYFSRFNETWLGTEGEVTMDSSTQAHRLEEYKQIREEAAARELAINQLFIVTVTASTAILSAVTALFFKIDSEQLSSLSATYAYSFLGPFVLIVPILYVLIEYRRDIHRLGIYLQVFYEQANLGPKWQTHVEEFRRIRRGESLDVLPWVFWGIAVAAASGFVFALIKISPFECNLSWLTAIIVLLVAGGFLLIGHWKFWCASSKVRDHHLQDWLRVRQVLREQLASA